jgi:hypothetical protein
MKLNRIITVCAMTAALALSVGNIFAQDNGGGPPPGGGNGGDQQGQNGGRRNRQGGGPGGGGFQNMSQEERTKMMMDGIKDRLEFTNDTDWSAVQPLVQKVLDARRDVGMGGGMRAMFGGRNRGGDQGGGNNRPRGGGMFGQPSPEEESLSKALEDNAPAAQVKDLLAKYKASKAAKQAKLEAAQDALKAVLTSKQEAQAYLIDLVR